MMDYSIAYLRHDEIDKAKWDACIRHAPQSLIYNYSWYLDIMAGRWNGLVWKNYEAVMPLVWKKKYGIRYLYQPFFTAQIGITGRQVNQALTDAFLQQAIARFTFSDIDLAETNAPLALASACRKRVNMLLDITRPYPETSRAYHRLAGRMLAKAHEAGLYIQDNAPVDESMAFYYDQYHSRLNIRRRHYQHLARLFRQASAGNHVISLAAKDQNGKMAGMYLLLKDEHYVYSVVGGSSAGGKKVGAFYLLTDHAIRIMSGGSLVFRFEGSDFPGIAAFNAQFGATPFYYSRLRINKLPFFIRLFKK